ncbi:MAG: RtcB family protein [Leptotrichiaceae bacterium]|nr:RtcB family protein [Leptotrichiaceae bacterium]
MEKNKINIVIHAINYDYGLVNDVYESTYGLYDEVHLMPDTHRGKDVPIGFVAKVDAEKGIIPNLVGVDIGCGMSVYEIPKLNVKVVDWHKLYRFINENIPSGTGTFKNSKNEFDFSGMLMKKPQSKFESYKNALGTLGGGNHFIEINSGFDNDYIVIHSGSRKFGLDVCTYYNRLMKFDVDEYKSELDEHLKNVEPHHREEFLRKFKAEYNREANILTGEKAKDYLNDMQIAQQFASESRKIMIKKLLEFFNIRFKERNFWESVHNYIDFEDNIVRKGATPARKGQKIIVPINMRDGSIIAVGKGNEQWLNSAPHGAGRVMSRKQAKENISMTEYKASMEGINTFTVNASTLDEAPMAYRNIDEIIEATKDTMEILEVVKPIFNFKGGQ